MFKEKFITSQYFFDDPNLQNKAKFSPFYSARAEVSGDILELHRAGRWRQRLSDLIWTKERVSIGDNKEQQIDTANLFRHYIILFHQPESNT